MKIVEYKDKYQEEVKDLLVELEEYIVSIDKDNLDTVGKDYRDKMLNYDLSDIYNNDGKCYLMIEKEKVIGMIMGKIVKYNEIDYLDYKCPKKGEITELIVTKKVRSSGVGTLLINKMEDYFKKMNCEYVCVDVFSYNEMAFIFYNKHGFHSRMQTLIRKI